jgi:O-antigen/teichoic acid export membrane protein
MNFAGAIVIYLLVFVVLLWVFSKYGMGLFSALAITSLLAGVLLLALIPPSEIEHQIDIYFSDKPHKHANDWIVLIYLILMILSLLLIAVYIIYKAFEDRERRIKVYGTRYNCDYDHLKLW